MGSFLLREVEVRKDSDRSFILGRFSQTAFVKLEFVSNGDTSDFTEEDIIILMQKKLSEIEKQEG